MRIRAKGLRLRIHLFAALPKNKRHILRGFLSVLIICKRLALCASALVFFSAVLLKEGKQVVQSSSVIFSGARRKFLHRFFQARANDAKDLKVQPVRLTVRLE
jgi:hypothetical protein